MEVWEIVGGVEQGGVIVKEGQELTAPKCSERLSTGALIKQLDLVGERLRYQRLSGTGPETGWVSVSVMGKQLCVKTDKRPATMGATLSGFEVLVDSVELQPKPDFPLGKRNGAKPSVKEGSMLWGVTKEIDGHSWLELTEETINSIDGAPALAGGGSLWAPISVDLSLLGIGVTLEVLSLKEERQLPTPTSAPDLPTTTDTPSTTAESTVSQVEDAVKAEKAADEQDKQAAPTAESTVSQVEEAVKVEKAADEQDKQAAPPAQVSGGGAMFDDLDALDALDEEDEKPANESGGGGGGGAMFDDLDALDALDDKDETPANESGGGGGGGAMFDDLDALDALDDKDEKPANESGGGGGGGGMFDDLDALDALDALDEGQNKQGSGGGGMFEELADMLDEAEREIWEVVGGEERGGIMVKDGGLSTSKKLSERLETGSLVAMIEMTEERLHYQLLEGKGPKEGWVALKLGARDQVVRTDKRPSEVVPQEAQEETPVVAASEASPKSAIADDSPSATQGQVATANDNTEVEAADELPRVPVGPMGQYFIDNFGWKPPTMPEVVEMLKDFVAAYSTDEFQMECRTLPDGPAGFQAKQELLWQMQRPIIGKYNFPQSREGGGLVGEILAQPSTKKDPVIAELQEDIFKLLLDPKLQDKLRKEKEAKLAAEAKAMETPEAIRKRQMEKERKEEQLKELTKKAAIGAETVLGIPVKYKVLSASPLYEGPFFASTTMGELEVGKFVRGYPGSRTWVKMDILASRYDSDINPEMDCWMPSANRVEGKTEILEAVWSGMTLKEAYMRGMKVAWVGLDTPAEPFQVEYFVEWKGESGGVAHGGQGLTPFKTILLTGMPPDTTVSVRVTAKVNASVRDVAGECILPGPWQKFKTLAEGGEEKLMIADQEKKGEGLYEISAKSADLYAEPSLAKDEVYTLKKGAKITGAPRKIGRDAWLQLTEQTLPPPVNKEIGPGESFWILLKNDPVTRLEDREAVVVNAGDETFRVSVPRVVVRDEPSTSGKVLGFRTKGAIVKGTVEEFQDGWEWLKCQFRATPSDPLQEGYMLIDGAPLGLPRLMLLGKEVTKSDQAAWKASLSRPMPPRPLTASWMASYGGVPALYSVREELLPAAEDVGMNSQCTLVYTAPEDGGSEVGYVAKRATVKDDLATKDTAEQEYRFYAEMVYPPPGETQPPDGEPLMFLGAVRVPRCHCVNFLAAGKGDEDEEDEVPQEGALPSKGRNQYFLLLEMFTSPYWVSMNPANGVTMDQAMSAITSLAKMHKACQKKEIMDKLSWLPLTIFDLEKKDQSNDVNEEDMITDFKQMFELNAGLLRKMLPDAAFANAEKLSRGGIDEIAARLQEEPLTFCHGDYRTENIRFGAWGSPPEVGTFDFGLSCRAIGAYDVAYFLVLSQPPHIRRDRDLPLMWRYLEEITEGNPTEQALGELFEDVKKGVLGVFCLTLMTRIAARSAGFYKETRETQTRLLRWVCLAVEEWNCWSAMSDSVLAEQQAQ